MSKVKNILETGILPTGTLNIPIEPCDGSNPCGDDDCQACCPHDEHDHGICLDCGLDRYEDLVGQAESTYEGDR